MYAIKICELPEKMLTLAPYYHLGILLTELLFVITKKWKHDMTEMACKDATSLETLVVLFALF